jgi:nucleoside-diphosphate-sugar epimerase
MPNSLVHRNIILTGATGGVGSHVLFELLRDYIQHKIDGKIILLVRANRKLKQSAYQRIVQLLSSNHAPNFIQDINLDMMLSFITVIESDLNDVDLEEKLSKNKRSENCYLIHSAATTNLRQTEEAYEENYKINYQGSLNLLKACASFVAKFTFISTTYSSGIQQGMIPNNYSTLDRGTFRNHYEVIKAKLEEELKQVCAAHNIKYQILRPAIVCGRLLDKPFYRIASFSVFYGYAKFFHGLSNRKAKERIRIECTPNVGLHIVPVDYVAKLIARAYDKDYILELNIAPRHDFNVRDIISVVTGHLGFMHIEFTTTLGEDPDNVSEHLYYKKVDPIFGPYMKTDKYDFDISAISDLFPQLTAPDVREHIEDLISFAVEHNFKPLD